MRDEVKIQSCILKLAAAITYGKNAGREQQFVDAAVAALSTLREELERGEASAKNSGRLITETIASRDYWMRLAETAEARLATLKPIEEAVKGPGQDKIVRDQRMKLDQWSVNIISAALALKEQMEKEQPK